LLEEEVMLEDGALLDNEAFSDREELLGKKIPPVKTAPLCREVLLEEGRTELICVF
jgi:hypothetical protein